MIDKFKITKMPLRTVLKMAGVPMILNQEYPITDQVNMTADVIYRGVPFDNFTYKLRSDTGAWSSSFEALINAEVDTNTPDIPSANLIITTNSTTDISSLFVPNTSTDRIKVNSVTSGKGDFWINGEKASEGKTYMLYEFINLYFTSNVTLDSQNSVVTINIQAGNKTEFASSVNITLTTSGNLQGTVIATSNVYTT